MCGGCEMRMKGRNSGSIKQKWTDIYGKITVINYMIYGDIGERDMSIINYAIKKSFSLNKSIQILEHIDFEMAELFNLYQGTHIQWIFPDEVENKEKVIQLISEGLSFQRIKNEFIGATVDVYERTT